LALCFSWVYGLPWPPPVQPIWLLGCGAVALMFVAANLALQLGATKLPAQMTAVVMLIEILFASVSSIIWGDQILHVSLLVGGSLILLAGFLSAAHK
jgi:drug/metabolite transporter (DMT)-like permease